jgi:triacylglycerol lipase
MPTKIPYSARKEDLFHPCHKDAVFFPDGRPATPEALCAELSRLVYCKFESTDHDKQKVLGILRGIGFGTTAFFSVTATDTQGFLTTDTTQHLSVLALRGTEADDPTDVATDATAVLTKWENGGRVHGGFAQALLAAWPRIQPLLESVEPILLFTGHSLGAALATLAASKHRPTQLYTFGSPRVGDAAFTNTLAVVDVQRYVDCCDIVCRIPPESFEYRHVGTVQYINRDGVRQTNPTAAEIHEDRAQGREEYVLRYAWKIGNVAVRELADHAPINYVSGIIGRML